MISKSINILYFKEHFNLNIPVQWFDDSQPAGRGQLVGQQNFFHMLHTLNIFNLITYQPSLIRKQDNFEPI